jgi:hypothetical protein
MRQYIPSTSASAEQKKLRAVVDETVAIVLYEDNYPVLECGAPDWKIKPANGPGLL